PGLKVGVAWQGNPQFPGDRQRSFPLARLEPLARVPGVRLFSLQKGHGSEQLRELGGRFEVTDLGPRLDEGTGAFLDTAAVMKNLDLVVSPNTALVHLAGALAVRLWVPLPLQPEWRWPLGREDSPWYPTARVFRQERPGDWPGVFARMAEALRPLAGQARGGTVEVEGSPGELIDKITILEVKSERLADAGKLPHGRPRPGGAPAARAQA